MLRDILIKYKKSILYILISIVSMFVEFVIGYALVALFAANVVLANTVSVISSAFFHFFFVTKKVFARRVGIKSGVVYTVTFFMGLAIQNFVFIGLEYGGFSAAMNTMLGYAAAKMLSVGISFVVMYNIRKYLYSKI